MTLLLLTRRIGRLLRRVRPYAIGIVLGWLLAFLEGILGDKVLRLSARGLSQLTVELDPADTVSTAALEAPSE